MKYKGHTIEQNTESFHSERLIIYPTEQGIQHDYDYVDGSFVYMGNCKRANSIEEAKRIIDDKIAAQMPAFYKVETYALIWGFRLPIITKFTWLSEAVKFASERNGLLIAEFKSI